MAEGLLVRPRVAAGPRGPRWRAPSGARMRLTAWRVLWAPFWVGSDVPAPRLPGREARPAAVPEAFGLAGAQVAGTVDRLARRMWLQRAAHVLVRALWLAVAIGCAWLVLELTGGPALDVDRLAWIAGGLVGLGFLFALLNRPNRRQVARMLDRSFGLQERVTTAVDNLGRAVPREGERASVVYLQVADAANAVASIRRQSAFALRPPVRELVLAVACGLLMAALYFLRGVGDDIPPVAAGSVPVFTPAVDRPPEPEPAVAAVDPGELAEVPTSEEVRERAQRSNQLQRDLQELGQALADHPITREAAEAIQRGDYDAAANDLRDVSTSADQLSEAARQELAGDLEQAAAAMSPESSRLSGASQEAAEGLRQGEQAAQEGVRQLGDAVEETGSEVIPQQELAQQMQQAEAADAQRGQQQAGGEQQAANAGQPGQRGEQGAEAGQPGSEGADAEPGQAGESAQQGAAAGEPGQDGAPGQDAGGQRGAGSQPGGEAGQQGTEPDAQPGGEGMRQGEGLQNPGAEAAGEADSAQAGAGAGSGEAQDGGAEGQPANPGATGDEEARGDPAAPNLQEGEGEGGAGPQPDDPADVTAAVELPRADGGEGVQTSNDGGSASVGSGAGVMVGSGSAVQGEVGDAGPDSNRVPAGYRSLVERYFSEPGTEP